MSKINFMGSYSGIDKAQIDKMMEAEKMPLIQMSNKKVLIDRQKGAWKDVNSRLKTLFDKMEALKDKSLFDSKIARIGDDKVLSSKANDKAIAGAYNITVDKLATNSKVVGVKVNTDGKWKATEDGSFTIKNADFDITKIEIADLEAKSELGELTDDEKAQLVKLKDKMETGGLQVEISVKKGDTLEDIADKINEVSKRHVSKDGEGNDKTIEGSGIRATVIDGRLVLEDSKTGGRDIGLEGNVLSDIGLDVGENNPRKAELNPGTPAKFIVNGIEMTSDSNRVSDKVRGLTLDFKEIGTTTINVTEDNDKMEKAIGEFVDQYNSTMTFIDEQLKSGNPEAKDSRGALAGDSALMSLQRNLRSLVTDKMNSSRNGKSFDIKSPSQLGISTVDELGTLAFNATDFRKALEENPSGVRDFFGAEKTGFVDRFNKHIDKMVSSKNGIIKTKDETFDRVLKDLNKQIDNFNDKMERKEAYYIKTFSALDVAMMQAESQMSWLSNQVSAMNPGK